MSDCLQKCISLENNPKSTYGHSKYGSRTSFWQRTRVRILIILKNNIFWWICLDVELLKGTPNVCSHGHATIEETRFRKYWRSNMTRWECKYKNQSRANSGRLLTRTSYARLKVWTCWVFESPVWPKSKSLSKYYSRKWSCLVWLSWRLVLLELLHQKSKTKHQWLFKKRIFEIG